MNNKLFVGNLSYSVTEEQLKELFSQHGTVISASLPKDRDTGRVRGFGFVEMETQAAAEAAIKNLDGHELSGRQIKVNISTPKPRTGGRY
ncbi:MAG: RNA-binding protein [Candidatus Obscuribacterales bacterium]